MIKDNLQFVCDYFYTLYSEIQFLLNGDGIQTINNNDLIHEYIVKQYDFLDQFAKTLCGFSLEPLYGQIKDHLQYLFDITMELMPIVAILIQTSKQQGSLNKDEEIIPQLLQENKYVKQMKVQQLGNYVYQYLEQDIQEDEQKESLIEQQEKQEEQKEEESQQNVK